MASTSQENNNDTQQQNHDVNVVNNKIESSVKKVIKPVSTLGKINPGVLKNLKDAMKCAVAKSKGVGGNCFFLLIDNEYLHFNCIFFL